MRQVFLVFCRLRFEESRAAEALQLVHATQSSHSADMARLVAAKKRCHALSGVAQSEVDRLLRAHDNAQSSAASLCMSYNLFEERLTRGISALLVHPSPFHLVCTACDQVRAARLAGGLGHSM